VSRQPLAGICLPCQVAPKPKEGAMLIKRDFYINGRWVAPIAGRDCNVINPSNEEPVAVI